MNITQQEADSLIQMKKRFNGNSGYEYPGPGDKLRIPLESLDKKENFNIDINRSCIALYKVNLQMRAKKTIALVRVDIGGGIHRNPDDTEVQCPHIHIYREGWGDKWAEPLPNDFRNPLDIRMTLDDFLVYCRVVVKPIIKVGLFS